MREEWYIDGWELTEGLVRDIETREGLHTTPEIVGANPRVANRTGEAWRRKRHGAGLLTVNIWVGAETNRAQLDAYYNDLIRAAGPVDRLPKWERVRANGEEHFAHAELVGSMAPVPIGQLGFRLGLQVRLPDAYWFSDVVHSNESTTGAAASRDVNLTEFQGATAPLERLTYRIYGPAASPRVDDVTHEDLGHTGDWFRYVGTIGDGQWIDVNSETWQVTGGGGFTPELQRLEHSGPRYLSVSPPRPGQTSRLRLTASNTGTATRLTVTGRRAYQA